MLNASSGPEIIIASRIEAEGLLISSEIGADIKHVISIGAPGDKTPAGFERRLSRIRLDFHDVTVDTAFEFGPSSRHVKSVIDFARAIEYQGGRLLIHCEAGISRSSAAALTVFAVWLGVGKEDEAVAKVYAVRPEAWPNSLFVELADQLLSRDGTLLDALRKVQEEKYRQYFFL
ncbi:MAG: tyrosine phosphatase family protein [Acidiferrobacterales bacterium]